MPQTGGQFIRDDLRVLVHAPRLRRNVSRLRSLCTGGQRFCAVVKANAYGHGVAEVVRCLRDEAVDYFAVANLYEAIDVAPLLRPQQNLFVFEPLKGTTPDEHLELCARHGFHGAISSTDAARHLVARLGGTGKVIHVHVNIDTGMGRLGIAPDEAMELIRLIDASDSLALRGVYTHFATADEEDLAFAHRQVALFDRFARDPGLRSRPDIVFHAANSAATMALPQAHYDMVRCGIAMYGYCTGALDPPPIQLEPVLELQAPIIHLRPVPAGTSLGYGRTYWTQRDTLLAVLPYGYADGYSRLLGNQASVRIQGISVPVVGRVCMDHILLDATDVPGVQVGDWATVIDSDPQSPAGAGHLAALSGTIPYEILTRVNRSVPRILVE